MKKIAEPPYGSVMTSNYNTRPLAAEVLVKNREAALDPGPAGDRIDLGA